MNLKPYKLPPETTRPLLRFLSGLVPRGRTSGFHCCLYACMCVCVYVRPRERCTAAPLSSSTHTHLSCSTSSPSVIRKTDTLTLGRTHTKGHIWAGLAHSSFYTNVGDKSAVIECASVQLFSLWNNPPIVPSDHQGPQHQSLKSTS